MIFLKYFDNHSGYQDYTSNADYLRPNVSHCKNDYHVHYGKQLIKLRAEINAIPVTQDFVLTNLTNKYFSGGGDLPITNVASLNTMSVNNGTRLLGSTLNTNFVNNQWLDLFPDSVNTTSNVSPYVYVFTQEDGTYLSEYVTSSFTFNEDVYNYSLAASGTSILLSTDGDVLKKTSHGEELVDANDNYITTNIIPIMDGEWQVYDENNEPIFYNGKINYQRYVKILNPYSYNEDYDPSQVTQILNIKIDGVPINYDFINGENDDNTIIGNLLNSGYIPMDNNHHIIEYTFNSTDSIIGKWLTSCNCLTNLKISGSLKNFDLNVIDDSEILNTDEELVKKIGNLNNGGFTIVEARFENSEIGDISNNESQVYSVIDGKVVKVKSTDMHVGIIAPDM